MATVVATVGTTSPGLSGNTSAQSVSVPTAPTAVNLSNAQTGNGASTNVVDRSGSVGPAVLRITTTIGATPTCTYTIEGSPDGTNFFAIQYADSGTPQTIVNPGTTFAITTATTVFKFIPANTPVRYIRVSYSSNTNVTNTTDAYSW